MSPNDQKTHWEEIYKTKSETEFSWFQAFPRTSVEFIQLFDLPRPANIIDIGGGDSHLVDVLLEKGYENIYVLDISEKAIERAKHRLGRNSSKVNWIISNITEFNSDIQFDLWHDRATFHFLIENEQVEKYLTIAKKSVRQWGNLILGTFSENGPATCSGLNIKQYSENSMSQLFADDFQKIKCIEENHSTPFQSNQTFTFCSFKRL